MDVSLGDWDANADIPGPDFDEEGEDDDNDNAPRLKCRTRLASRSVNIDGTFKMAPTQ